MGKLTFPTRRLLTLLYFFKAERHSRFQLEDISMETLLKDIRYGIRSLAKRPGFTALALITLPRERRPG